MFYLWAHENFNVGIGKTIPRHMYWLSTACGVWFNTNMYRQFLYVVFFHGWKEQYTNNPKPWEGRQIGKVRTGIGYGG